MAEAKGEGSIQAELASNPLAGLNPISRHKIFDVYFEGANAFRVVTTEALPDRIYLYEGEQLAARVKLTPDKEKVEAFDLVDLEHAKTVLHDNLNFPFRTQLEGKITEQDKKAFDFNPSTETAQKAELAFQRAFAPDNFLLVPAGLIGSILREQPEAVGAGLHIPAYIEGQRNPMSEEYFSYAFGWLLGNGYEISAAQQLANELVNRGKVLVTSDLNLPNAELEQERLACHEAIHVFFAQLYQSKDPLMQETALQIKYAYLSSATAPKPRVIDLLTREKYSVKQQPEEFWTYYLTALAYPPPKSHPLQAFVELGKDPAIQEIMDKLTFLKDMTQQTQVVKDALSRAKKVESKV